MRGVRVRPFTPANCYPQTAWNEGAGLLAGGFHHSGGSGSIGYVGCLFPGLDLGTGLSLLMDSALVAGACLISGVSTILFERHLGYDEQESVSKEGEE